MGKKGERKRDTLQVNLLINSERQHVSMYQIRKDNVFTDITLSTE